MKKKYYILVLTFLCMLCGQMSYGMNDGEGNEDDFGDPENSLLHEGNYGSDPSEIIASWTNDDGHTVVIYENEDGEIRIKEYYYDPESESVVFVINPSDSTEEPSNPIPDSEPDTIPDTELTHCDYYPEDCEYNPEPDTNCQITSCPDNTYELINCECIKKPKPPCLLTSCPIPGYIVDKDSCECVKKDCEDEKYEQAIRNKDIIFTKKYGWVDLTHAFIDTIRDSPIGVNNLWNQLKEPPSQSQIYMGYYSVNYKQDVVVAGVSIGIERQFLVRPDLTLEERKSVALAIFQNVSTAFELLQSVHPTSTSSFEPADLPSNMLNFYRHVEGLTKEQILAAIEPVSIEQSIEVLKSNPCTFASDEYKNRSFEPFRFETPYTSQNFGVPDLLNTIEPFEVRPAIDFGNADLILLEQDIISN